jgi:DUF1680 family protein
MSTHPPKASQLKIFDSFWTRYIELIRTEVIPYQWEALNDRIPGAVPSYAIYNLNIAAGRMTGPYKGPVFLDSDLGKWIEAVGYTLSWSPDPELEKLADEAIDLLCAAQREDGYLNSYYILTGIDKRWTNLMSKHELYCLGHLLEGAIAYYEGTGKNKFLNAIIRYVDLVEKNFGSGPGKINGYPGHEEIEIALVKLYEITKDEKYFNLAKYFIDQRGQKPNYFEEEMKKYGNENTKAVEPFGLSYYQADIPVREQRKAAGHAVRAVYLYSGMADIAGRTGDKELWNTCRVIWEDITTRQMYITGSIGQLKFGEAFSYDYDLPNDTSYAETCAAIGLIFFARRMLENHTDSCYADVMERALYNGVISGISLDGKSFFYVNPLEVLPEATRKDPNKLHVKPERQKWFGCACCPPNIARLLSSLGSYVFTSGEDDSLFMHLYISGEFTHFADGKKVLVKTETRYPWEGRVTITISADDPVEFKFAFRIPGWCSSWKAELNGEPVPVPENGYVGISRTWKIGDRIEITFDMPVVLYEANPAVREDFGKTALMRGPLVYCLEEADNGADLHHYALSDDPHFKVSFDEKLLGGIALITGEAVKFKTPWPPDVLYREAGPRIESSAPLVWIPYYAWANRGLGEMKVWLPRRA